MNSQPRFFSPLPVDLREPEIRKIPLSQIRLGMTLAQIERSYIEATLEACNGNKTRAASQLGISLKTLYNRLNEWGAL